jgi:ParB-like chromosome segregation protein Spo0J
MGSASTSPVLELHPLCTLFPRLVGQEFDALKSDIIVNGQREPIVVHEGLVLDGGNRYRACIEAGVEPVLKNFTGTSAVSFVLSANLHRRHLSAGQQAAIVASAQDWTRAQRTGGDRKSDQAATLPLDSVADRAAQSGASERTQRMADKVARESPDLAKQVAHGDISLPKAIEQLSPKSPKPQAVTDAPCQSAATAPVPAPSLVQQVRDQQAAADDAPPADADDTGDEPDIEGDPFEQLVEENKAIEQEKLALQVEIKALNERIAILTRDDLAAAADEWKLKFEQLSGRNRQLQETAREAQLAGQRAVNQLAKIRKALGVESNAEILPALTTRRAA